MVITDIQMPPNLRDDGLAAALTIRSTRPEIGVMVLSQFLDHRYAHYLGGRARGGRRVPAQGEGGDPRKY